MIVHLTQFFNPLSGYQELYLARHSVTSGEKVIIITSEYLNQNLHRVDNDIKAADKSLLQEGIVVIRVNTFFVLSGRLFSVGLIKLLIDLSPDVLYCHGFFTFYSFVGRIYKSFRGNRLSLIMDDHMVAIASRNIYSKYFYLFVRIFSLWYFKKCSKIIFVSESTKEFYKQTISRVIHQRSEVIPLGVNTECFKFNFESRSRLRESLGIKENDVLILYTGKRDQYKNPIEILNLNEYYVNSGLNCNFVFVGSNINDYDNQFNEFKGNMNIILLEHCSNHELSEYYSAADVAIWPNESSMSMLEAMSNNCLVVASDLDINKERLQNRGILFSKLNWEALYERLSNRAEHLVLKKNAFEYVSNLKWETVCSKILNN